MKHGQCECIEDACLDTKRENKQCTHKAKDGATSFPFPQRHRGNRQKQKAQCQHHTPWKVRSFLEDRANGIGNENNRPYRKEKQKASIGPALHGDASRQPTQRKRHMIGLGVYSITFPACDTSEMARGTRTICPHRQRPAEAGTTNACRHHSIGPGLAMRGAV
jgi:hypothetical protein